MPRPCSVCAHPARTAIDEALRAGESLDEVTAAFGLPSRSALQRHRSSHVGRAVTIHIPANPGSSSSSNTPDIDGEAALEAELSKMLARASRDDRPSVQQVARIAVDELLRVVAAAKLAGDREIMVRAIREIRSLMELHTRVKRDRLREGVGWYEVEAPGRPNPIDAMMRLLMGPLVGLDDDAMDAVAELDRYQPGYGSSLADAMK